jgi:hypothetical protein
MYLGAEAIQCRPTGAIAAFENEARGAQDAAVATCSRIYVLGPESRPEEWARLFEGRPPRAVLSVSAPPAAALARRIAARLGTEARVDPALDARNHGIASILDDLVALYPARSTLLAVADREWMGAALGEVWGVEPPIVERLALTAAGNLALDWPTRAGGTPSLVGFGLDWLPPDPPRRSSRYPGGPGAAASGKA